MIVHWIENAIRHLTAIYHSIAQDAPLYAQRVADKLTRRSEQLAIFAGSGRQVPEYQDPTICDMIEPLPNHLSHKNRPDRVLIKQPRSMSEVELE